MPGTPTPYYGFPIPAPTDPANAPSDFQALAQKIEDTLKNGYTIPDGDLTIGKVGGAQRQLTILARQENIERELWQYIDLNGNYIVALRAGGTTVHSLFFTDYGQVSTSFGGVGRYIPFATFSARTSITLANAASGTAAITLPVGRFNAPAGANTWHGFVTTGSAIHFGYVAAGDNTSITVGVRHVDNTPLSQSVTTNVMVVQMTPTSGPG